MKYFLVIFCMILFLIANARELSPFAKKLLTAKTVQIDTSFPYYQNRSVESIASEIELNGFNGVYYYVMTGGEIMPGLIDELHRRGIAVALMTLPNIVYATDDTLAKMLPANHRQWLMKFTSNDMDNYRFIGFVYPEYNEWYKNYLGKLLKDNQFDGFTFAEIMYPIYDGPARAKPFYGDVSENFKRAFKAATNNRAFPNFDNPHDPNYFKTNAKLYNELVEYRIKTINDFYDDIVNSSNGARSINQDIMFATWTLGINIPDGVAKLREWEGNDIDSMIRKVKPDIHFIQTHAPDWNDGNLKGDYPYSYKPFFDAIRVANPDVKVALQADLGSTAAARRNLDWQKLFYKACQQSGVSSTTYYEFGLRYKIYEDMPELKEIYLNNRQMKLYFDQRLSSDSAKVITNRLANESKIISAKVDGNILVCDLDKPISSNEVTIDISDISDEPELRFPSSHLEPMPRGPKNRIAKDTVVTMQAKTK